MTEEPQEGIKAKCKRCEYAWTTKGKMFYVPCPRCHTLVKIRDLPQKRRRVQTRIVTTAQE